MKCGIYIQRNIIQNKILLHPTTWMNLEDIMLNEIKQKDKHCMIPLTNTDSYLPIWLRIGKFIETESNTEVTRGSGEGEMGSYCLMAIVSTWDDEKVLEMDSGDGCTTLWTHLVPLNCTLKMF